nr:hypothetical protein CFP56_05006 [Quercus suber]
MAQKIRNPIAEEASYQKAGATILNSNLRNLEPVPAIFGFGSQRNPIAEEASYQKAGATILNSNLRNLEPG